MESVGCRILHVKIQNLQDELFQVFDLSWVHDFAKVIGCLSTEMLTRWLNDIFKLSCNHEWGQAQEQQLLRRSPVLPKNAINDSDSNVERFLSEPNLLTYLAMHAHYSIKQGCSISVWSYNPLTRQVPSRHRRACTRQLLVPHLFLVKQHLDDGVFVLHRLLRGCSFNLFMPPLALFIPLLQFRRNIVRLFPHTTYLIPLWVLNWVFFHIYVILLIFMVTWLSHIGELVYVKFRSFSFYWNRQILLYILDSIHIQFTFIIMHQIKVVIDNQKVTLSDHEFRIQQIQLREWVRVTIVIECQIFLQTQFFNALLDNWKIILSGFFVLNFSLKCRLTIMSLFLLKPSITVWLDVEKVGIRGFSMSDSALAAPLVASFSAAHCSQHVELVSRFGPGYLSGRYVQALFGFVLPHWVLVPLLDVFAVCWDVWWALFQSLDLGIWFLVAWGWIWMLVLKQRVKIVWQLL